MASRVESFLRLLGHEPMTVYLIGDATGFELTEIQDTLEYMEDFGMVEHRQGYWVRPDQIAAARMISTTDAKKPGHRR